ncbi:MAG: hypothetical protein NW226_17375 [Microscillaceae bacterium]|nr:hypothetical protein [Microscillaceae bacterium]
MASEKYFADQISEEKYNKFPIGFKKLKLYDQKNNFEGLCVELYSTNKQSLELPMRPIAKCVNYYEI